MLRLESKACGVSVYFYPEAKRAMAWTTDKRGMHLESIDVSQISESDNLIQLGNVDEIVDVSTKIARRLDVPLLKVNRSLLKKVIDTKEG